MNPLEKKSKAQLIKTIEKLQKKVEALESSEKKFRCFFNDAPDMMHIVDANGRIIEANRAELKKMGYTKKEYLGKSLIEIIHPDYLEDVKRAFRFVMDGKKIKSC